jgi:ribonuclease Z
MKLLFLGTAAGTPSRRRNVSGLALLFAERREWWLFDCGEGTQQQLLRTQLSISQVRRIFISHLHGDHCFGLPGLMASRGLRGAPEPLDVYGPRGIEEYLESIRRTTGTHFMYPYVIHTVTEAGVIAEDDEYLVHAFLVRHAGPTLAFVVEEKLRPGRFRVEQAEALGIPPGPVYARLKRGETIQLADGRVVQGAELVDPPRPGRKVAIVCDTSDASAILPAAQNAQVLVHEATFLAQELSSAGKEAFGHSSAAGAGRLARQANVERLVLNHFSARYEQGQEDTPQIKDLVSEAEQEFIPGRVIAAEDFLVVDVPRKLKTNDQ